MFKFYILFVINMEKTEWCVTQDFGDYIVENTLFTYDESEREEQAINKTNASLILNPKFIPVYPSMIKDGYSYLDCIVYGFIDFFLCNNDKFYCTNEQLGEMLWTSEKTVSLSVKKLKENWLIDISYRIKAGGGKVRFIKLVNSDFTKMYSGTLQKCKGIDNKIIENKKINKSNWSTLPKQNLESKLANICKGDLTFTENVIERLNEYNNTRKKKLEKLTDKWFKLVIDKLVELWHGTEDWMIAVLKQSVEKWWEWLFEVKGYKPKVDYENNLQLFLTRLKTDYEWLKKEVGTDKFFELKQKALEYWAANKLL